MVDGNPVQHVSEPEKRVPVVFEADVVVAGAGVPDTLLRNRMAAKVMGEACGIAAAMSAAEGIAPKQLDCRQLQDALLDAGFYLGDRHRLKELGLV